ncbi:MAG: molecular chaperone DnaJ [bacterium]
MSKDYYDVLGVSRGSSHDEVKKAFHKKAHEFHPDKATGNEAKFKEINEAYQVLGDKDKRARYDQFGSAAFGNGASNGFSGFQGFSGFGGQNINIDMDDLGDLFGGIGDMFGFGSQGSGGKTGQHRGRDIQMSLSIDFHDAVFGAEKEIKLRKKISCNRCGGNGAEPGAKIETCQVCRGTGKEMKTQRTILGNMRIQSICSNCDGEGKTYSQKCAQCSGSGTVNDQVSLRIKIPAGIDEGEAIRLSGQGEAGEKHGSSGDLYLKIKINQDNRFVRDGYDIKSKAEISFTQAALGDKISIDTINGPSNLKIPSGTQSGTIFKLRGYGIAKLRGIGRGDQMVEVIIKTPRSLTRKQKELLKELNQ